MTKKQEELQFTIQSTQISECTDVDGWAGEGVTSVSEDEIQEITAGDDKPFYVEFVALYEGMSNNQRRYSKEAVETCVDAMVGVNMYKGHEEPGTQSWKYREPVGRVVASKLDKVMIDGKSVLAAKGKAYITEADSKLRTDIKKKMAGAVSILGNARMVRQYGEAHKTVTHMHKPLKSVDFCNPGTGGLSHAGVTGVVSEMDAQTRETEPEVDHKETQMTKLTKDELLKEYKPEITALVGEQIECQVQEIAAGRREIAEQKESFKEEKAALEAEVAEMKTKVEDSEKSINDWKAKYETERDARIESELAVFANDHVAEMSAMDGADKDIIKMAAKRCKATVVDGDLEKSKASYKAQLKASVEEVTELSEMFGGKTPITQEGEKPTKRHKRNTGGEGNKVDISSIMSPDLAKARKDRVGA